MEREKKEEDVQILFMNLLLLLLLAKILCINGLASLQPHSLTPHRWTNKSGPTHNHSEPRVVMASGRLLIIAAVAIFLQGMCWWWWWWGW